MNKALPWLIGAAALAGIALFAGNANAAALPTKARAKPKQPSKKPGTKETPDATKPRPTPPAPPSTGFVIQKADFYTASENYKDIDLTMVKQAIAKKISPFDGATLITYSPLPRPQDNYSNLDHWARWMGFKAVVEVFDVPEAIAWTAEAHNLYGPNITHETATLDESEYLDAWERSYANTSDDYDTALHDIFVRTILSWLI